VAVETFVTRARVPRAVGTRSVQVEQNPLVEIGLPVALFVIMVGIGLTLTSDDFRREARQPKSALLGSLGQLILMPALGFAIAALLSLPPALAVGLVIVAACPGGTTSNLVAYLCRANVALSIVLTVIASLVTILTLPLAANLALAWQPTASDVAISVPIPRTVALLIGIVLIPVAIGMTVRRKAPARAASLESFVSIFGAIVLVVVIVGIAISVRDEFWELLSAAGPAALLLNLSGILAGIGLGALTRVPKGDRLTFGVELGIKNSTLGILIAATVIGSERMAVPAAVYGLVMYVSAIALVAYGRRAARSLTQESAAAPGT
jgi:bile acid:Na+ symporter, BASS family